MKVWEKTLPAEKEKVEGVLFHVGSMKIKISTDKGKKFINLWDLTAEQQSKAIAAIELGLELEGYTNTKTDIESNIAELEAAELAAQGGEG
jgi:hypothetical protein